MQSIKIGWIDFSKEQRNKVMSVINLLSEPGVIDELGIGIVRDAFADIFFPGTSTIQTRAKYFMLIPYLFYEIEKEKKLTPEKMIHLLHEKELDLIELLKAEGTKGVIGESAGRKLKRKPSEIYWNGLRTFGIFTGGKMSLNEFARVYCNIQKNKKLLMSTGVKANDGEDGDDKDAHSGDYIEFWNAPIIKKEWRDTLTIKLSYIEANYLRKQIIRSFPDNLFSYILKSDNMDLLLLEDFDSIKAFEGLLPATIQQDYGFAKNFADFIYGIHIRYNMMLSKGDEEVSDLWNEWHNQINTYSDINLNEILRMRLKIKNIRLIVFLEKCRLAMKNNAIDELDGLIIQREKELKGSKRAKLCNINEFQYKGWVGIGKLQYRLNSGLNIIADIKEGLGERDV